MYEMIKLNEMLFKANIHHTFMTMDRNIFGEDAFQIRIYRDGTYKEELDDVVFHNFSHGHQLGLLETYNVGDCNGFETAEQVFEGWVKKFFS